MLEALIVVLLVIWLFGWGVLHLGWLIHAALVVALLAFAYRQYRKGQLRQ